MCVKSNSVHFFAGLSIVVASHGDVGNLLESTSGRQDGLLAKARIILTFPQLDQHDHAAWSTKARIISLLCSSASDTPQIALL